MNNPMTKHTPGPWMVDGRKVSSAAAYGGLVAEASQWWYDRFTAEANARLIAKAPEMLEWIKRIVYWAGELEDSPLSFARGAQEQMQQARNILKDLED